jgi:hypothetical protein
MKNQYKHAVLTALICSAATSINAMEQETHALLTYHAYLKSKLSSPAMLYRLGLSNTALGGDPADLPADANAAASTTYLDMVSATDEIKRLSKDYENSIIVAVRSKNGLSTELTQSAHMASWLMRGAIREDDNPKEPDTPNDAPVPIKRPLHHFFDPWNNRALDVPGVSSFLGDPDVHKNPDWAIGARDVFTAPDTPEAGRRNHFTLFDAREAMWRALTLKRGNDTLLGNAGDSESDRATLRKSYWNTVFRALGDVLHLNQDMAQPQHTRNEAHSGIGPAVLRAFATGHTSYFEKYLKARTLARKEFEVYSDSVAEKNVAGLLFAGNYEVPKFKDFREFWSTQPGTRSLGGKGLADYTNTGFFTDDNNIGSSSFNFPTSNVAAYTPVVRTITLPDGSVANRTYLLGDVKDNYTNQVDTQINMTRKGAFTKYLAALPSGTFGWGLDQANYDATATLVVPRAVAYSAGILDRFFRGSLAISLTEEKIYGIVDHSKKIGFERLKLMVANTTEDEVVGGASIPQTMSGGKLALVARYRKNTCYADDLSGEWGTAGNSREKCRSQIESSSTSVATLDENGAAVSNVTVDTKPKTFQFIFNPPIPLGISDLELQIVYRGKLGSEEDAVVASVQDISEPTYIAEYNHSDFLACYHQKFYRLNPGGYFSAELSALYAAEGKTIPTGSFSEAESEIRLTFNSSKFFEQRNSYEPAAKVTRLAPGEFSRFAVLTGLEDRPMLMDERYRINGFVNLVVTQNSATKITNYDKIRGTNYFMMVSNFAVLESGCNRETPIAPAIANDTQSPAVLVPAEPITEWLPPAQ